MVKARVTDYNISTQYGKKSEFTNVATSRTRDFLLDHAARQEAGEFDLHAHLEKVPWNDSP